MKTIKQMAEELGVSKQKVYRYIRASGISESHQDSIQNHIAKHYDDVAEARIKAHFFDDEVSHKANREAHQAASDDVVVDAVIEMLQRELEVKNQQIADLTSALVAAQQTAAAAQALHAGTMKHLAVEDEKKPGVLSRLFGRYRNNG